MLSPADWRVFVAIMGAGHHVSIAQTLRAALWNYGNHFHQQGLIDLPRGAFALKGVSFK